MALFVSAVLIIAVIERNKRTNLLKGQQSFGITLWLKNIFLIKQCRSAFICTKV